MNRRPPNPVSARGHLSGSSYHAAPKPTAKARSKRLMAIAVVAMLTIHALGVLCLLWLAQRAGADTQARLDTLQWSFPKTAHKSTVAPSPAVLTNQAHLAWKARTGPDTPGPWRIDPQGNVLWNR
jgi:hypothetical protein